MTISMLGTTTNGEPETYWRQDNVFVCVQDTAFTAQTAIKLLRDSACTACPFHLLGILATTFVQVCSLVSYSNLTLIYYYLDVSVASIYCGE